jgi:hypothetical protein
MKLLMDSVRIIVRPALACKENARKGRIITARAKNAAALWLFSFWAGQGKL